MKRTGNESFRSAFFCFCRKLPIFERLQQAPMVQKPFYTPPEAEIICMHPFEMLAMSFNDDNNSEYFDEEYGGNL